MRDEVLGDDDVSGGGDDGGVVVDNVAVAVRLVLAAAVVLLAEILVARSGPPVEVSLPFLATVLCLSVHYNLQYQIDAFHLKVKHIILIEKSTGMKTNRKL